MGSTNTYAKQQSFNAHNFRIDLSRGCMRLSFELYKTGECYDTV